MQIKTIKVNNETYDISADYSNIDNTPNLATVATSGSYNDLSNKPNIPDSTSDLQNDSGFITNATSGLENYYTKTEVDGKVSSVYKYKGSVATYDDLPSTDLTVGDVYNVQTDGSNYAWDGSAWDKLGGDIDLSGYQTKIDSSHKLDADLVDDTSSTNKFVSASDKTNWNSKQDLLTAGTNITIDANNVISASGGEEKFVLRANNTDAQNIDVLNAWLIKCDLTNHIYAPIYYIYNSDARMVPYNNIEIFSNNTKYRIFFVDSSDWASNSIGLKRNFISGDISNGVITTYTRSVADFNTNNFVSPGSAQTISGKKTFSTLPESSVVPTTANQLTNKSYVDNNKGQTIQYSTMPTADSTTVGKIVQYTGTTDSTYTNGYFYIGTTDGETTPTYSWENIEVQAGGGGIPSYYLPYSPNTSDFKSILDIVCGLIDENKPFNLYWPSDNNSKGGDLVSYYYKANNGSSYTFYFIGHLQQGLTNNYGVTYATLHTRWFQYNPTTKQYINLYQNDAKYVLSSYDAILGKANTTAFTPTGDYNPATKKYVDDSIASAITTALGGNY